jgi:hypothetical protein
MAYAFLIFRDETWTPALCEGGVYSDAPEPDVDYDHNTLEAAHVDAASLNRARHVDAKGCYEVVTTLPQGTLIDANVISSLVAWQVAALPQPLAHAPQHVRTHDLPQIENEHRDNWFRRARAAAKSAGGVALWSGRGPVPQVGDVLPVSGSLTVRVDGYSVDAGWLMLICERSDGKRGNLAGAEIAWKLVDAMAAATPEFEVHAIPSPAVTAWLKRVDHSAHDWIDGKRAAVMRRDRNGVLQVWSLHVSEAAAKRAIRDAAARRPVR